MQDKVLEKLAQLERWGAVNGGRVVIVQAKDYNTMTLQEQVIKMNILIGKMWLCVCVCVCVCVKAASRIMTASV